MQLATIICEVCKDNSKIYKASENASAKTTNRGWGDLRKVNRTNNDGLANAESSNESAGIYSTQIARVAHEYRNTEDPEKTKLTSSPETANTIANKEGSASQHQLEKVPSVLKDVPDLHESSAYRADLNHS
jgi:hypothetical protein